MSDSGRGTMHKHPARGMYDQIEDTLTSITMQLRSAIQADSNAPARVNAMTSLASGPFQRESGRARRVTADLGSVLLDTLGLAATVEWHMHQFQKCTGIRYELTVKDAAGFDLPEECAATIFEIYSEVLSNVARHAGASHVAIALTMTPHEVTLVVADNGIGLGNEAPASVAGGLAAIRARSRTYQGFCEIAGARYAGTTVTARLPIA